MFALSTLSRRTPTMMKMAARACSTRTLTEVNDLEAVLKNRKWVQEMDTVKDIRQLLNEKKTNHTLPHPGTVLEDEVCSSMKDIQAKLEHSHGKDTAVDRDQILHQILGLKKMVKGKLYSQ